MREDKKDKSEKIINIIAVCSIVLVIVAFVLVFIVYKERESRAVIETAQCEILDKYREYHPRLGSGGPYYTHHLTIAGNIEEGSEFESTIEVSSETFYEIFIGDMISCEVSYVPEGIIDIEIIKNDF